MLDDESKKKALERLDCGLEELRSLSREELEARLTKIKRRHYDRDGMIKSLKEAYTESSLSGGGYVKCSTDWIKYILDYVTNSIETPTIEIKTDELSSSVWLNSWCIFDHEHNKDDDGASAKINAKADMQLLKHALTPYSKPQEDSNDNES